MASTQFPTVTWAKQSRETKFGRLKKKIQNTYYNYNTAQNNSPSVSMRPQLSEVRSLDQPGNVLAKCRPWFALSRDLSFRMKTYYCRKEAGMNLSPCLQPPLEAFRAANLPFKQSPFELHRLALWTQMPAVYI